jgi:hypothetical protein
VGPEQDDFKAELPGSITGSLEPAKVIYMCFRILVKNPSLCPLMSWINVLATQLLAMP